MFAYSLLAFRHTPFYYFIINVRTYAYIHKKRRLRYCSSTHKGLRTCPLQSINNNETYADMTNPRKCTRYNVRCTRVYICHTRRRLIAYFVLTVVIKSVRSFLCVKYKASINAFYMSKIHPKEETYPLQRRFSTAKVQQKNDIRKSARHF